MAAVVPIRPGMDLESYGLSHNAEFIEIINRSWQSYKSEGGVSLEQVREKHGLKSGPKRKTSQRLR